MKIFKKYLLFLLSILVITSAIAITATAADGNGASNEYSYSVYDPTKNSVKYYTSATQLNSLLTQNVDGAVITLLKDVTITQKLNYAGSTTFGTPENKTDYYLDLNGKKLIHAPSESGTFIEIYNNTNLNVYSSSEGGMILSAYPTSEGYSGYTLFNLRYSGAHLTLGEVEAPVIELDTDPNSATYNKYIETGRIRHSGDNVTTYSGQLVTTYYSSQASNQHEDLSADIIGGTHYKTHDSRHGMFLLENDVEITVKNAKLHVMNNAGSLVALTNSRILNFAEITFINSEIYTPDFIYESSTKYCLNFDSCDIACDDVPNAGGAISYNDCLFTSKTVRTQSEMLRGFKLSRAVNYQAIDYNFSNGALNAKNPFTLSNATSEYVFVTKMISDLDQDDIAKIDWVTSDETITEYWLIGEDVIPTPPISETYEKTVAYSFSPAIVSTAVSGNTTYTLTPRINFTIRANLALYSDFIYNLYIPKSAADSDNFISARIDRFENGNIIQGETLAVKGGEIASISVGEGYSEEYYILKKSILATEGDTEFRLVITIKGAFDDTITHIQEFSIFDYAKRVNAGNYAENAKAMVNSTVTYIKAARNYSEFVKNPDEPLPYPVEGNPDLEAATGSAVSSARGTLSEDMKSVFYAMTLSLQESIKFRFYLYPNTSETVKFTYRVNTKPTEEIITVADCTPTKLGDVDLVYYDLTIRAIDLRSAIQIDLLSTENEVDYTYRLANYVHSVKGSNDAIDNLMDTMFAYSIATNTYLRGETTDTPSVDISISNKEITSDSYVIVANADEASAANALRLAILERTGENIAIVNEAPEGKSVISFEKTEPSYDYDLRVAVNGNDLVVRYGLVSFIENGVTSFVEEHIKYVSTDKSFASSFVDNYRASELYYSDFGAVGDGVRDDFQELYNAHAFANATGKKVKANSGATYYIHNTKISDGAGSAAAVRSIQIKTDTDWTGASFIIDDSDINYAETTGKAMATTDIFVVQPDISNLTLVAEKSSEVAALKNIGFSYGTTNIDLGLDYPAMLIIYNANHKVYRRSGSSYFNSSNGSVSSSDQHELILVDENGNIDPSTPFLFDYATITSIVVVRTDVKPITLKGGTFTTIACGLDASYVTTNASGHSSTTKFSYYRRGLAVNRSYTVVENVNHLVVGEITPAEHSANDKQGAHYHGFFNATNANDILIKNCTLQGRRYYNLSGTYDFQATCVNKIILDGCIQSNFWIDENDQPSDTDTGITSMKNDTITINGSSKSMRHCWGIGGTNFCKNMSYQNSRLSRFDAHQGLYNGSIINCEMTFFSLIGKGDFLIKDTVWYAASTSTTDNALIYLRGDYGSTWEGDITIQNVTAYVASLSNFTLFYHGYNNWDYGYKCYFPNVEIDGLKLYNMAISDSDRTAIPKNTSIKFMNFSSEYNMHLDDTIKVAPTRVFYDEATGEYSQTTKKSVTGMVNDNPITPPEFIRFLNNDMGYDFTSSIKGYMEKSTFFNGTRISVGTKKNGVITETNVIHVGKTEDNTPAIPFD